VTCREPGSTKYQDRRLPTASSIWPGPQPRLCCCSSISATPTRNCNARCQFPSSTPTPRCAPIAAVLIRTRAAVGLWGYASPAICDRAGCRSATRPISTRASSSRPMLLAMKGLGWTGDLGTKTRRLPQRLQDQIMGLNRLGHRGERDRPAGRHLRPGGRRQIPSEDRVLLQSVARAVITTAGERWPRARPSSPAEPRAAAVHGAERIDPRRI